MKNLENTLDMEQVVDVACTDCGIPNFPDEMSNEEVAMVCRWLGELAPDCLPGQSGEKIICREGFDMMILIMILEFPRFFEENNLAMVWRN